jgi:hypothetical protein
MAKVYPGLQRLTEAQRRVLLRAVRYQAIELGIRQFVELGAGLPAATNVHQVAQDVVVSARVVYVVEEPLVAAHCRALLRGTPPGRVDVIEADLRKPQAVLDDPILAATLDLGEPVGLLLSAVLEYVFDEHAHAMVATLVDALPAGSCVTITHPTADFRPAVQRLVGIADKAGLVFQPRTLAQVSELFAGLELVEPGVVPLLGWRPQAGLERQRNPRGIDCWAGMASRP